MVSDCFWLWSSKITCNYIKGEIMTIDVVFVAALLVFAVVSVFTAIFILTKFKAERIGVMEKIPRNVPLGVVFGAAAIAWCIPQAVAVFSADSICGYVTTAIICFLIGCFFLDYLFARAFAGFSILLAHYFLYQSFAAGIPFLWLFSLAFLVFGTFGIVIGGMPHLLRDLIRKACLNTLLKKVLGSVFTLYAIICVYAAVIQLVR